MTRLFKSLRLMMLLTISLLLAGASGLAASAPAGSVVAARGKVEATDDGGTTRALKVKSEIFAPDTIQTGKDGRVQLMFSDHTIVSLGVDSVLKVAEYRWNGEQKDGAMKTAVEEGTFRVLGGLITKQAPKNFTTETPAATIGIRGSMYAGKASRGETMVVFLGGKGIVVYNPLGQVEITRPGYGVMVRFGEAPGEPRPMTLDELAQLLEGMTGEGSGDALVSDRTTNFDKATEGRLPFDPDGFAPPLADFMRDVIIGQEQGTLLPQPTSQAGYVVFEGTAVGLFEGSYTLLGRYESYALDAYAVDVLPETRVDRRLVSGHSGNMSDVMIFIDRDAGRIDDGWMDVYDFDRYELDAYPDIDYDNAVYFNDHAFTAGLACMSSDGGCVDFDYGNHDLEPGGYIMTASSSQFSPYVSWGYWGASFVDEYGTAYQTYKPGSLWVAGEKTESWIVDNIGYYNEGFVGEYRGPAYGVRLDETGVANLTGGRTVLYADFSGEGGIWGSIAFDQHTINFDGGLSGEDNHFNASAAYPDSSEWNTNVTGAFYGPAANAVGGSFYSTNQYGETSRPAETYQGIFGGNLVNGPIQVPVD